VESASTGDGRELISEAEFSLVKRVAKTVIIDVLLSSIRVTVTLKALVLPRFDDGTTEA